MAGAKILAALFLQNNSFKELKGTIIQQQCITYIA